MRAYQEAASPACISKAVPALPKRTKGLIWFHFFSSPVSSQSTDLPNSRLMARFPLLSGIRLQAGRDELSVLIFRFDVLRRAVEN